MKAHSSTRGSKAKAAGYLSSRDRAWPGLAQLLALAVLGCAAVAIGGCGPLAFLRPARDHVETTYFVERGPEQARGLIVLLPGYGDRPDDFQNHRFLARLREHAPGYDMLGVDAHFNYYRKGRVLERLEQDAVGPARARGYENIWLLGVSMGGLGAVTYARAHPEQVSGVILFAPFWGRGNVMRSVASAPSLCDWDPSRVPRPLEAEERSYLENWRYLRARACLGQGPEVWLAYGESDPPPTWGKQVERALPEDHVVHLPGGHGWSTWAQLLDQIAPRVFPPQTPPGQSIAQN